MFVVGWTISVLMKICFNFFSVCFWIKQRQFFIVNVSISIQFAFGSNNVSFWQWTFQFLFSSHLSQYRCSHWDETVSVLRSDPVKTNTNIFPKFDMLEDGLSCIKMTAKARDKCFLKFIFFGFFHLFSIFLFTFYLFLSFLIFLSLFEGLSCINMTAKERDTWFLKNQKRSRKVKKDKRVKRSR